MISRYVRDDLVALYCSKSADFFDRMDAGIDHGRFDDDVVSTERPQNRLDLTISQLGALDFFGRCELGAEGYEVLE